MQENPAQQPMTVTYLSRLWGVPVHQLRYALQRYRIEPATRAGIVGIYSADQLPSIRSALARVKASRRT